MDEELEMDEFKYEQIVRWLMSNHTDKLACALCDRSNENCECYANDCQDISSFTHLTPKLSSKSILRRHCSNRSKPSERSCCSTDTVNEMDLIRGCTIEKVKWQVARADLLFRVEDSLFPVHRSLLAEHSKIFREYALDDQHLVVRLPHKVKHFTIVLDYIYSQHIPDEFEASLTGCNVIQVLNIAETYGVDGLVDKCNDYLQKSKRSTQLKKNKWLRGVKEILGLRMFVKN